MNSMSVLFFKKWTEIWDKTENLNNTELLKGSHINIHIQIDNTEKKKIKIKTLKQSKVDEPKSTFW